MRAKVKFLNLASLVVIFGLVQVIFCSPSSAQESWRRGPSITGAATPDPLCNRGVGPGATCFWTFNNSVVDSPVLDITAEYATVYFNPNIAAATGGPTISVMVANGVACSDASASQNTADELTNGDNIELTGLTVAGNANLSSIVASTGCIWIDPATATAVDSIVKVVGAPVGRQ